MARRPPKPEPDLNITSFCDIITVSIVALFMSLVIVIDIAMKTPKLRTAPYSRAVTNTPVYVECRGDTLYPINRSEIEQSIRSTLRTIRAQNASGQSASREENLMLDMGNQYYRIDNSMLAVGAMVLHPRLEVEGLAAPAVADPGPFGGILDTLNTNIHYLVYLVRDDSFNAYRQARDFARSRGFLTGWEYLGIDEPISFDGLYKNVRADL